MSAHLDPDTAARAVFVLAERYDALEGPWHAHRRAQLVHASEGVLTVRTREGLWVVPPQRAVWILPGVSHQVSSRRPFWLHTLYAEPGAAPVPAQGCVVSVDRLVDALLVAAAALGPAYPLGGPEARLIQVILDRLPSLTVAPLHLPGAQDSRLVKITAARLFLKDTGLTFGQWRQQLRLIAAMALLGAGESVSRVAFDVGYADVSSFISAFKAAMGETPARYFRAGPPGSADDGNPTLPARRARQGPPARAKRVPRRTP